MFNEEQLRERIQKLIDEHLIGWWVNETASFKGHYTVIPENLIEFIEKFVLPMSKAEAENAKKGESWRLGFEQGRKEAITECLASLPEEYRTFAETRGIIGTHYSELEHKKGFNSALSLIKERLENLIK